MFVQIKFFSTRPFLAAMILAVGLGGLTACADSTDPLPPHGIVKFLNMHPLAQYQFVDFGADGNWVFFGQPYAAGLVPLRRVSDGTDMTVSARAYSGATVAATATLHVGVDTSYNAFFIRDTSTASGARFLFTTDTATVPSAGNAKIQFANLSPSFPAVDVYLVEGTTDINTVSPTFANFKYLQFSPFTEFTVDNTSPKRVVFTRVGEKIPLLNLTQIQQGQGWVYMMILLDANNGGAPPQVKYLTN